MRSDKALLHGEITSSIIDSFFEVHKELGFGFREYLYARAQVVSHLPLPLRFGRTVHCRFPSMLPL